MSQQHPPQRTQSRASTASIHSIATQPNIDQQSLIPHHGSFQDQWTATEHGASKNMSSAPQPMPAEDMMLRPASQMQVAQPFSMGPNMHPAVGSTTIPFHQHPNLHHAVAVENFGANGSFTDADSQMMDREDGEEMESVVPQARSKNGSSRTSANNELEMRQLFQSNQHRTLKDVAKELHGNERGPNSERARQIFAMLW